MKRLILSLFICWLLLAQPVRAQLIVHGVNVNKLDIQYIGLIGYDRFSGFSKELTEASVWLDLGQGVDFHKSNEFLKPIDTYRSERFKSTIDALNYLYKNGWELIQQYLPAPNSYHHYVLQRRNQFNK